jgi:hypothetical protein
MITYDVRCAREIKFRIAMAFNKKERICNSKLELNLRKKLVKCYMSYMTLYGAETWTLRKVDQKYLENFDMWGWRKMAKNSWANNVRNEEVLQRGEEYLTHNRKKEG